MKKNTSLLGIVMIFMSLNSCDKNDSQLNQSSTKIEKDTSINATYRSTSEKEYADASPFTKRLINQIDAAVNALNSVSREPSTIKYEAVISIDKNPENKLSNFVIIAPIENAVNRLFNKADGKCHICGLRSAYSCIKEVEAYMDAGSLDEIDVHIKRSSDGCVDITYK